MMWYVSLFGVISHDRTLRVQGPKMTNVKHKEYRKWLALKKKRVIVYFLKGLSHWDF